MDLSVTIGAKQDAFVQLRAHSLPGSGHPLSGQTEILASRFYVVKSQSGLACGIAAALARATLIFQRHQLEILSPFVDEKFSLAFDAAEPAS